MFPRLFASACAMAIAAGAPLGAQDAPSASVQPALATAGQSGWTGPWIGFALGHGRSSHVMDGSLETRFVSGSTDLLDLDGSGALYGVEAGYDFAVGPNAVVGLQADYTMSNITNGTSVGMEGRWLSMSFDYALRPRSMGTIAARGGFLPTDSTLIYGLVGYTRGTFRGTYTMALNERTIDAMSGEYSYSRSGIALGAGIEAMITDNVSLKMEYRHNRFSAHNMLDLGPVQMNQHNDMRSVRAVVAYRF